uniref:Peptidase S1 domain-containing protein n=1 Tax=Anopheles farauti TaxID=69004 RepID=A0A182QKT5_9DIPT
MLSRRRCAVVTIVVLVFSVLVASGVSQSCGKRKNPQYMIHNANESKDGSWPWHAVLYHKTSLSMSYVCGGTILDQNSVLTAAHCLVVPEGKIALERLVVQVGRNRLGTSDTRVQEFEAYNLIIHPKYNINRIGYDIAIIKLSADITYNHFVQPVCLWKGDESVVDESHGTVIGFGFDESNTVSKSLREARIPVVGPMKCIESNQELYGPVVDSSMFCAGNRATGVGPCNGDSGGGMFFTVGNVWYIRGMVSFTKPRDDALTCDTSQYTVLTNVTHYRRWIQSHMRNEDATRMDVASLEDRILKTALLPVRTCGYNPYANRQESSKPLEFGYPWLGRMLYHDNRKDETFHTVVTLISELYLIADPDIADAIHRENKTVLYVLLGEYIFGHSKHCGKIDGKIVCAPIQRLRYDKIIWYSGYEPRNPNNVSNIALVRLLDRADTSQPNVKPICLPLINRLRTEPLSEYVVTTDTKDRKYARSVVELVPRSECYHQWKDNIAELRRDHICVSIDDEDGTDCRQLLSGASLQAVQKWFGKQRYVLHGLSYINNDMCDTSRASIFVNIGFYIDWILDTIEE